MEIGKAFLTAHGALTEEVTPDGLRPAAAGYRIRADAILTTVQDLMQSWTQTEAQGTPTRPAMPGGVSSEDRLSRTAARRADLARISHRVY